MRAVPWTVTEPLAVAARQDVKVIETNGKLPLRVADPPSGHIPAVRGKSWGDEALLPNWIPSTTAATILGTRPISSVTTVAPSASGSDALPFAVGVGIG